MSTAERNKSVNESVNELIARQFGVISRTQAARFGISPPAMTRRVQSGEWARVLPGVYRVTAAPVSFPQSALAATLWAGPGSLVSHGTAAALHGFAWPGRQVGVECEGYPTSGGRARWDPDRARLADLAAIEWRLIPVTWGACTGGRERVVGWLRRAVPYAA